MFDVLESTGAVAERATLSALLRCCVREVAAPHGEVWPAEPYLMVRVAGTLLRVRAGGGAALRFGGPAERLEDGAWHELTSDELVALVEAELGEHSGEAGAHGAGSHEAGSHGAGERNDEFAGQVAASREAIERLVAARAEASAPADPWLASEQALVFGHPFHPSPKARGGSDWLAYAPEAHASFPLRMLAVRDDVVAEGGDGKAFDALGTAPPGYALLPAHPWQVELLRPRLAGPIADGLLVDLGPSSGHVVPTSSVRTVYEPVTGVCLKFSVDVRITNCVRKNAWYELEGAVELDTRLGPVFDALAEDFPGTSRLREPGYRSASLGLPLLEGLGVIVREGPWAVCGPGVTPLLAGALATREVPEFCEERRAADPVGWWTAYVRLVAPPVLDAYLRHGVVLEPHLQNVLVGVDGTGMPVQVIFRDMEGTKLVAGRHDVSGLPERVAAGLTYAAEPGWNRVAYCLMVNHLTEIAATVAESAREDDPRRLLSDLWAAARSVLSAYAERRGRPAPLPALLAGAPLPAKANLSVRWARAADRAAGYVPVANPLAGSDLQEPPVEEPT
ncbi:Siderophore synthetase component [Sinosporangium album]|uniref:Siderophore synthetase component n=2 Tax=Sinosporangium album TaxID=504805 RepID=A0A1G7Y9Y8_9ACTN|nr:Siderophore synthetase component [Sinosporangium album]